MSRSFRKTPIFGHAKARSERFFKQIWHRGYRSRVRQQVCQGLEPLRIQEYKPAAVWNGNKDGKHWYVPRVAKIYDHWMSLGRYSRSRFSSFEEYKAWWEREDSKMMRK